MDINTIIICSTILLGFIFSMLFINNKINRATSPKHVIEKISNLFANNKETQSFLQDMSAGIFKSFKSTEEKISGIKVEEDSNNIIIALITQILMTPNSALKEVLSDAIVNKIDFIKQVIKKETEIFCDPMMNAIDDLIMMITMKDHHLSSNELAQIIANETAYHPELRKQIMSIKLAAASVSTKEFKEMYEAECEGQEACNLMDRIKTMGTVIESLTD